MYLSVSPSRIDSGGPLDCLSYRPGNSQRAGGWIPAKQMLHQRAEREDVASHVGKSPERNFRRYISSEGSEQITLTIEHGASHERMRDTKVANLRLAGGVENHTARVQSPVADASFVQRANRLGNIEDYRPSDDRRGLANSQNIRKRLLIFNRRRDHEKSAVSTPNVAHVEDTLMPVSDDATACFFQRIGERRRRGQMPLDDDDAPLALARVLSSKHLAKRVSSEALLAGVSRVGAPSHERIIHRDLWRQAMRARLFSCRPRAVRSRPANQVQEIRRPWPLPRGKAQKALLHVARSPSRSHLLDLPVRGQWPGL